MITSTFALLLLSTLVASADEVRVVKDVDYVDGEDYEKGKDRLDLYFPKGAKDVPVVVFFHGGGLRQGDKSECEHVGRAFAGQGVGAVAVNYRLSPGVAHPEHAEDAARSVAWVRQHVKEYGGNPGKIFLAGHSAGGYLVSLLSTDLRYLKAQGLAKNDIAGVIPISGFFWVEKVAPDRPKDVWGADPKLWPEASPAKYISSGAPPTLFLYADGDDEWRRQQNEEIA
ncbi:MAG TPA: alpha/beta hydrolase, partial [Vicinamibacteria bacterium]